MNIASSFCATVIRFHFLFNRL